MFGNFFFKATKSENSNTFKPEKFRLLLAMIVSISVFVYVANRSFVLSVSKI